MGDHFLGEIWDLLSRMGCDHPCVSFVFSCGYLGSFYFWWCSWFCEYLMLVVYLCVLSVDRVSLCFGLVCSFVQICVMFRFVFVLFLFLVVALALTMRTL